MKFSHIFLITITSFLVISCTRENQQNQGVPLQEIVFLDSNSGGYMAASSGQPFPVPSYHSEPILQDQPAEPVGVPDPSCSGAMLIESDVRGTSMLPVYQEGDMIRYSSGYYHCYDIKRNDIIIYHHPRELLIKRVVGVPGDSWKYLSWQILIGKKPLKNTEGQEYAIDSKILRLYADSYPIIPEGTYLILGNQISGTLDSSRFGLIAKQDIVGKVISKKEKK